jgi:hypothetical protein
MALHGPGGAAKRPRGEMPSPAVDGRPEFVRHVRTCRRMACETMAREPFDHAVGRLLASDSAWEIRRRENMAGQVGPGPGLHVPVLRKRLPLGLGIQLDPQTGEIFREDGGSVRAAAHVTLVLQWLGRARGRLVMVEAFGEQHERNLVQCVNSARQLLPKNAIEYMDGGYRLSFAAEVLDGDVRTVGPFTVWPEQRAVLVAPRGMSEVPAYLTDREYLIFDNLLGRRGRPVRKAAIEAASQTTVNRIRYSYNTLRCKLGPERFIETPGCYQLM